MQLTSLLSRIVVLAGLFGSAAASAQTPAPPPAPVSTAPAESL